MRGWYIIDFWPLEDSDKPELHREAWRSLLWASIFAVINQAIAVGDRSTSVLLRCAVIPVFVGLLIGAWYDIRRLLQRAGRWERHHSTQRISCAATSAVGTTLQQRQPFFK